MNDPKASREGGVPEGVYYSEEMGNFYSSATHRGMGMAFWETWRNRRDEFPPDEAPTQGASHE